MSALRSQYHHSPMGRGLLTGKKRVDEAHADAVPGEVRLESSGYGHQASFRGAVRWGPGAVIRGLYAMHPVRLTSQNLEDCYGDIPMDETTTTALRSP